MIRNASAAALAAFVFAALLVRGPVTAVGPAADAVRGAFSLGPSEFGLLTAVPVLCFGFFSFPAARLSSRFGLAGAMTLALALLAAGCALRLVPQWGVLLAATAAVGAGIALLNVYLPVAARTWWPQRTAALLGLYTGLVGVSGSVGSLTAPPLAAAAQGPSGPFAFWTMLCLAGALLWAAASRGLASAAGSAAQKVRTLSMACEPLGLALSAVMGLQSTLIYTVAAWLPQWHASRGGTLAEGGFWLFVFLISGFPASFVTPALMRRLSERACATLFTVLYLAGMLCWLAGGTMLMTAGSLAAGASQGAMLTVAMVLMSRKSVHDGQMLAISAFAQGAGYIAAAAGPLLFGVLLEVTGSWTVPLACTALTASAWGAAGWICARWKQFPES